MLQINVPGGDTDRFGQSAEGESVERTFTVVIGAPTDPDADSMLRIHLGEPNASQLIQDVTGIELQVIDGVRYVGLLNGIKVVPSPSMRIDGFIDKGIDQVFPSDHKITVALKESRVYNKVKAGELVPRSCVSFIIPEQHDADIILEILLGRQLADKIQKDLCD